MSKKKSPTRDAIEEIYNHLRLELMNIAEMSESRKHDGFTDFDMMRLHGSLENAVEVYGEVLGLIEYDD